MADKKKRAGARNSACPNYPDPCTHETGHPEFSLNSSRARRLPDAEIVGQARLTPEEVEHMFAAIGAAIVAFQSALDKALKQFSEHVTDAARQYDTAMQNRASTMRNSTGLNEDAVRVEDQLMVQRADEYVGTNATSESNDPDDGIVDQLEVRRPGGVA